MSVFTHSPQTSLDSLRLSRMNSVGHTRTASPLMSLSRMDSPRLTQSLSLHGIGASSCSMELYIIDPSPRPSHSAFAPSWSFEANIDDELGNEVERPYTPTPTNNDLIYPSLIMSPSGRTVKLDLGAPTTMEYEVTDSVDVNALQSPDGMYPEDEEWETEMSPKEMVESSDTLKIAASRAEVKRGEPKKKPSKKKKSAKKKKNKKSKSEKKATKKETKKENGKKAKKAVKSKWNKKTTKKAKNEKKKKTKKDKVHKKKESEKVKRKKAKKMVKDQNTKSEPQNEESEKMRIEQKKRERKMTDDLIQVFMETTGRSRIHFDKISVTKSNGKVTILSSQGLTQGVHGWSIEILRADAELQGEVL